MLAEKPQHNLNHVEERQVNRKVKVRRRKVKRAKAAARFKTVSLAIMFLIGSLLVLSRYAQITNLRGEITDLEHNLEELDKDKLNLEAKLEGIKSSEEISRDAVVKLGMHYPKKDQIAYVSVEKETIKQTTKMDNVKNGMQDTLDKIKDIIGGIVGE